MTRGIKLLAVAASPLFVLSADDTGSARAAAGPRAGIAAN
jgi:hypothetical protein